MALRIPQKPSLEFPCLPSRINGFPTSVLGAKPSSVTFNSLCHQRPIGLARRPGSRRKTNAVEEKQESSEPEPKNGLEEQQPVSQAGDSSSNLSELGSEIKKELQKRKEKEKSEGGDFLSGVAEEVREIEWPAFGKVLGTTGVVLGVIAGSSVVLLTVNAILAELSHRVFAGKGVQDFFS